MPGMVSNEHLRDIDVVFLLLFLLLSLGKNDKLILRFFHVVFDLFSIFYAELLLLLFCCFFMLSF